MRFCDRTLALFISVFLLSESVAATPARMDISIAQQPAATSQEAAAAQRIFQEGEQLRKQGTAESLRHIRRKAKSPRLLQPIPASKSGGRGQSNGSSHSRQYCSV